MRVLHSSVVDRSLSYDHYLSRVDRALALETAAARKQGATPVPLHGGARLEQTDAGSTYAFGITYAKALADGATAHVEARPQRVCHHLRRETLLTEQTYAW